MSDLSTIRAVEEASLNAWPAHQTLVMRGWLLRFAQGYTRRANSINPIYPLQQSLRNDGADGRAVDRLLAQCEQIYRSRNQSVVVKITPLVQPPGLDDHLAQRGYRKEAPTGVRTRSLTDLADLSALDDRTKAAMETTLSDAWMEYFVTFNDVSASQRSALLGILSNIVPQRAFVTLYRETVPVACGLGVVEQKFLGLFDIVTAPSARGYGYGTQLLLHLLHWGAEKGATAAYLQVMDENEPARRLYDKLHFVPLYPYWYRVKK